jgi:hypothetical protein
MPDACELNKCTKRFYKYSGDAPVITSIEVQMATTKVTMNSTSNPQAAAAVKAAVEKRKKNGKLLKDCPTDTTGCKCKAPSDPPSDATWSAEETVKYKVQIPKFKVLGATPEENPATVHFTVKERHADVTAECGIEEEELGYVIGLEFPHSVVLAASEIASLAALALKQGGVAETGELPGKTAVEAGKTAPCSECS